MSILLQFIYSYIERFMAYVTFNMTATCIFEKQHVSLSKKQDKVRLKCNKEMASQKKYILLTKT